MIPSAEQMMERLSALLGQPLWKATRSLNLHCLHFGAKVQRPARKGGTVEVGSHSLHLQCAWRLLADGAVQVGSRDRLTASAARGTPSVTRVDEKLEALLALYAASPLEVVRVEPGTAGAFRLELTEGHVLEVFPDDSESEQWRYFDRQSEAHFVCTLEEDD